MYPQSKTAHMLLGKSRLAAGDVPLAIESYQRALALDPKEGQIPVLLDQLGAKRGAPDEDSSSEASR